jgi:hypothetical protein
MRNLRFGPTLLITASLFGGTSWSAPSQAAPSHAVADHAAIHIQDLGIQKLKRLLREETGKKTEPELLFRLAELQWERSGISFRISEGRTTTIACLGYRESLRALIATTTRLIALRPTENLLSKAYFLRGRARIELEEDAAAETDLLILTSKFPGFEWWDSAEMALGDLYRKKERHREALLHYVRVESDAKSIHQPFALHQAAWSRYALGDLTGAIDGMAKECAFYRAKAKDPQEQRSSLAFLEAALGDIVFFSFESMNRKMPGATIAHAFERIRSLAPSTDLTAKMALKLARMLKAYALLPELEELKTLLRSQMPKQTETAEVALLIYQLHLERRDWARIPAIASEWKEFQAPDARARLEPVLRESLGALHARILKDPSSQKAKEWLEPLLTITGSLEALLGAGNPTALSAKYALAETLFDLGEYREAAKHYRELEISSSGESPAQGVSFAGLKKRRLSAELRAFEKEHLIPSPFRILPLSGSTAPATTEVNGAKRTELEFWAARCLQQPGMDTGFTLQALKLRYLLAKSRDERLSVLSELERFAGGNPGTPEAVAAAGVVLDTFSESQEWQLLVAAARRFQGLPWKDPHFQERLITVAENSELKALYRLREVPGNDVTLRRQAHACAERATLEPVRLECSLLEAQAWAKESDASEAEAILSRLIRSLMQTHAGDPRVQALLLSRSELRLKSGRMEEANEDLETYQRATGFQDTAMTGRLLQHHWFAGNWARLGSLLRDPLVCANEFRRSLCAPYQAARILIEKKDTSIPYAELYRNTLRMSASSRALWCLMALQRPRSTAFQDRLVLLQRLGHSWKDLPPALQLHFLPLLAERAGETMDSIRRTAPGIAPLRADPTAMERRVRLTGEIESSFGAVLTLPSIELKVRGLESLAQLHQTLLEELTRLQVPANLLEPLREKTAQLRQTQKELTLSRYEIRASKEEPDLGSILGSLEFTASLPVAYRKTWSEAANHGRGDALLQIASLLDSSLLKGAALLILGSPSEAAPLITEAPDSPARKILQRTLVRRGAP